MTAYTTEFKTDFAESGDDPYFKPLDGSFDTWDDGNVVSALEIGKTGVFVVTLNGIKGWIGYVNSHSLPFTANASTDVITTASAHGLLDGETVRFKGKTLPAPLVQSTLYYIRDVTSNSFKVSLTPGGAAINITNAGSGAMALTAPSKRSANDPDFTVIPQSTASTLTGEAEDALVASIVDAFNTNESLVEAIVSGLYSSLSGISPTVSLTYDPRTMQISLTDGDDWKEGIRTINIPIELPDGVDYNDCTATFGAVKGSSRIDKIMDLFLNGDELNVRLTFDRDDTLGKPSGRYKYDVEVQYTDSESVVSSITVLEGILTLRAGIAKLPADI